jgi:hypothetical protein
MYEDLKRIMKELLFNGAERNMVGKFTLANIDDNGFPSRSSLVVKQLTPFQLLQYYQKEIPEREYNSLTIILVRVTI